MTGTIALLLLAATADPVPLQRTGEWTLQKSSDVCHLTSQYRDGTGLLTARITQIGAGDAFNLSLFRLAVDRAGAVTACKIIGHVNSRDLGPSVCQFLKQRARFEPALDSAGNPVASYYASSFTNVMFDAR